MNKIPTTEPTEEYRKERDALRMTLFSDVAHDLRTPLACIMGSLGTLEQMSAYLTSQQRDALIAIARTEAQKLDGFISEMLDKVKPL
jgi:two-component system, OmpR family, sensor histidine kinase KdpD